MKTLFPILIGVLLVVGGTIFTAHFIIPTMNHYSEKWLDYLERKEEPQYISVGSNEKTAIGTTTLVFSNNETKAFDACKIKVNKIYARAAITVSSTKGDYETFDCYVIPWKLIK